jgi:hypothetical protein
MPINLTADHAAVLFTQLDAESTGATGLRKAKKIGKMHKPEEIVSGTQREHTPYPVISACRNMGLRKT